MEKTIIIVKPDLKLLNLVNNLKQDLVSLELIITDSALMTFTPEMIQEFYQWDHLRHEEALKNYLCNEPLEFWLIQGESAIQKTLDLKAYYRKKWQTNNVENLFHSSDTPKHYEWEFNTIWNIYKSRILKTNNQVEVIIYKKVGNKSKIEYLLLKRIESKGGFWQPITGNVKPHEDFLEAADRELIEETGIIKTISLFDLNYEFSFFDDNRQQTEKVFVAQVSEKQKISLSEEHEYFLWLNYINSYTKYLKYPGNKKAFTLLHEQLIIND